MLSTQPQSNCAFIKTIDLQLLHSDWALISTSLSEREAGLFTFPVLLSGNIISTEQPGLAAANCVKQLDRGSCISWLNAYKIFYIIICFQFTAFKMECLQVTATNSLVECASLVFSCEAIGRLAML